MSEARGGRRTRLYVRIAVVLFGIVAVVVVMNSPLRHMMEPEKLREMLTGLRESAHSYWYAPLAFILAYVVGAALFVPATLFILAAAFLWGWLVGGVYALSRGFSVQACLSSSRDTSSAAWRKSSSPNDSRGCIGCSMMQESGR